MACPVAITKVTAVPDPNNPGQTNLTITGTQDGCSTVSVTVVDNTTPGVTASGSVANPISNWTITINGTAIQCGDTVTVTPICVQASGKSCEGAPFQTKVICPPQCPTISGLTAVVSQNCNPDGTRTVTLTGTVTLSGGAAPVVEWQFGDGGFGQAVVVNASGPVQATNNYAPGSYTAQLNVVSPQGCQSASITVAVPSCPAECPAITGLAAQPAPGCNQDGTRTVTLTATVTLSGGAAATVQWQFGDSNFGAATPVSASGTVQSTHNYLPGTYTAQVNVTSPQGCASSSTVSVNVPSCPAACPAVSGLSATVSPNCNPDGTRTVTLTGTVTPASGASAEVQWQFGDSNFGAATPVSASGTVQATHSYAAGSYTAQLNVITPSGCASSAPVSVNVGSCTPATCPQVTGLTAAMDRAGACAGQGSTVTVNFSGTVSPPPPSGMPCNFQWDFGDNSPEITTSAPGTSHVYSAPGTYSVGVVTLCGDCTLQTTLTVTIPPCCATVTSLSATVQGCAGGTGGTASATLSASTNPASAPGTYSWTFGDGATVSSPASAVVHSYTSSGSFSATVSFQPSDSSCPPSSASVTVVVQACPGGGGGSPSQSQNNFSCAVLLVISMILLLAGGILLILGVCLSALGSVAVALDIAGVICIVIGLILFVIWAFLCAAVTSCGLMETIYCILVWLVAVVIPVAAAVLAIFGGLPCALATALVGVGWGAILAWFGFIMDTVGCPGSFACKMRSADAVRQFVAEAFRLAIAIVWLVAAAAKFLSSAETKESVQRLLGGPAWSIRLVALTLPPAEMLLGFLLLAAWRVRFVAAVSAAVFTTFALLVSRAAVRDSLAGGGCGCFGVRSESGASGAGTAARSVARNLVLAILAGAVACRG